MDTLKFIQLDIPEKEINISPPDTLTGTSEIKEQPEEKIMTSSSLKDWALSNKNKIIIAVIVIIGLIGFIYYKKSR